eukprot:TRINITY_DN19839_c0_g1_i1.p1 TRINITY_DN19839_c0_g1~~TRINITY_DN19839_c0_g1_i1.p1  ORF type:complete len:144 (-),score=11.50 TRINITY_DN19839_c0_g1_i1:105-536(-)
MSEREIFNTLVWPTINLLRQLAVPRCHFSTRIFHLCPILRALGNLNISTDAQTKLLLENEFFVGIDTLLKLCKPDIRRKACEVLSNLLASSGRTNHNLYKFVLVMKRGVQVVTDSIRQSHRNSILERALEAFARQFTSKGATF